MTPLETLLARWRTEAALLRARGAGPQAEVMETLAREAEAAVREGELETLSLAQAAAESGYSQSQLYRLLSRRELENVGRKGAPRLRRGDLPRKPGARLATGEPDLVGRVIPLASPAPSPQLRRGPQREQTR